MKITKTFRYRLEPNARQRELFAKHSGCCRFVFNEGLAARIAVYKETGRVLSYASQCKILTEMKRADSTAWLIEVHSQVLQQALKDLDKAYQHFFRRLNAGQEPGYPKFKKKGRRDSFRYPGGVKISPGRVYLPKIGWVRYRDSRPIQGRILQATVKRTGDHWFICVACEVTQPDRPRVPTAEGRAVGIDVGLKCFAYLSDGTIYENPQFLRKAAAKMRKAQRALSRKVAYSSNWKKQARRVAKLHTKVRDSRNDFVHKISTAIVKNHDVIAVEDLNIKGMIKNRRMSRAISDVGWGMFLEMLRYKAEWTGKRFVKVGRFQATSQICSVCGKKKPMPLSVRTYECGGCGATLDRDWNASLNIRAAGLVVLNACGGA